ncbi:hypothetical protein AWP76_21270 [Escherichia coli]|nr:hypothetical protein AWP76_21270 [Escherichia coli]
MPVSAEPAGAVSGCRYGPMRENPGLAATVPQTALHVVAAGPCPLLCPVPFTCLSPCRRGLIQPQPAALTVQGK